MTTLYPFAARITDPTTSHEAAPTAHTCLVVKGRILDILTARGPLTHDQIRRFYIASHGLTSAQNIRTRTKELYDNWQVREADHAGMTASGRRAIRWDIYRGDDE